MLNYNERIILTEQYFTTGQQPEWTNLINKESGTTYYNVSIVTPTLRMNHILHNRPTINMKAIQCSTTQYSVRLLYILFCPAALIDFLSKVKYVYFVKIHPLIVIDPV